MKPAFSDVGLILKVVDFSEADKMVGILSHHHGYQEYLAKGARRLNSKKSPHLDLLNLVRFQTSRGHSPQMLLQADTDQYFSLIKQSFEKVRLSLLVAEIITSLIPKEEDDTHLYLSLVNYFQALENKNIEECDQLFNDFSQYLVRHLGYPPVKISSFNNHLEYFESIINKKIISNDLR